MKILGISAFYHDSAAVLVDDGEIIAAAQEERFTRRKHDPSFPENAARWCLEKGGIGVDDLDHVAFYDKPFLKFERLLETYVAFAPRGFTSFQKALPVWVKEKFFQKHLIRKQLTALRGDGRKWDGSLLFTEHHLSHAASAFYPSPFKEALILTMDGVGEWATASVGLGSGNRISFQKEIHFPHSLGLLYSAFTYYTGFRVNSGEYKLMGLAPYGVPKYADLIFDHLIDVKPDGSFRLNMDYFDYCTGLKMTNARFDDLFGGPPRQPSDPLEPRHMDLAASIQAVTEEIILRICRSLARESGRRALCLAGGVALNCVANGKLVREGIFDDIWIQPAAGDAGGALGAALSAYHMYEDKDRHVAPQGDTMQGSYLGPEFGQAEIENRLLGMGAAFARASDGDLISETVDGLADGLAVGWFQGRMEFGPRALGARSILGDPRSPTMQRTLNLKIKFRESFRPFAPSILSEEVSEWFDLDTESPYMLLVADVHDEHRKRPNVEEERLIGIDRLNAIRSDIPAVTHVDYSARVQTVHRETNPRYWDLLSAFRDKTGCPILVNTSFNVRGEPIVCTPEDAYRCFMGTEIDRLVIGNCMLRKEDQPEHLKADYRDAFAPD